MRFKLNSDPPEAPWHISKEHWVLCLMPIVERPCDTCGVVRDFRQQWIADQTLFVQWDTLPNHTSWQLSYCAAGTDPDHGTIVDCPLPQAVVGNIVAADDMVFYVRARCKDIRWRQWSPWSEVQHVELNAVVAPDSGPDALTVSPNPTTGTLHIDCLEQIVSVEVYSLGGSLLLSQSSYPSPALELDISSLPQALYILVVQTNKGIYSCFVAKQ
ncbi:MAG: T9SS type A sorting domain-containing protein [Bacteroidales bacterium]|nr:T9SS type A sorting domain-containing protein [Bacteroidales bacterium]